MRKIATVLLATLLLSACSGNGSQAENAGMAMAETACLIFDENVTFDQITGLTGDVMQKYGWEKPEDIDTYLTSIQGTPEMDLVKTSTIETLEEKCGAELAASGVAASDLADKMVSE